MIRTSDDSGPAMSVVIATYNRADQLRACLDALQRQACPVSEFEVIVVDDGSTDGTAALLGAYRPPYAWRVIHQANAGHPTALNRGISAARGRYCLLLDDDIIAGPELITAHLRAHTAHPAGVVAIGRLTLAFPAGADWYARAFAAGWQRRYDDLASGAIGLQPTDCYVANTSFPRETFRSLGGYATDLPRGFDVDLGFRLAARGLEFVYLDDAVGAQDERKGFRALIRDEERAGAGSWAMMQRAPSRLAALGVDTFGEGGLASVAARRALLALHVRPSALGSLCAALDWLGRGRKWARFVRRYAFWSGVRSAIGDRETWRRLTTGVTILMYHAIGAASERGSRYVVPARDFARQMQWLARRGYHVLSLPEYLRHRADGTLPPARSVVVTFDDGYRDNAELAVPVLAAHRFPATIFLVTDQMGTRNTWDRHGVLAERPLMTWAEAGALEGRGITLGPHSRTHRALAGLDAESLRDEIGGSWGALAGRIGAPVPVFAFPFGSYDDLGCAVVAESRLAAALTVKPGRNGPAADLLRLRRLEVRGDEGLLHFAVLLGVGTDRWRRRSAQSRSSTSSAQVTIPSS